MHYTVYKITNQINGKIYIGYHKTKNLDDGYMGSGTYLKRAQEKHGIDNFTKEILFDFDNAEDMRKKEAELVNEEFLLRDDVYNLAYGGGYGWSCITPDSRNGFEKTMKDPYVRDICLQASKRGKETQLRLLKEDAGYRARFSKNMNPDFQHILKMSN